MLKFRQTYASSRPRPRYSTDTAPAWVRRARVQPSPAAFIHVDKQRYDDDDSQGAVDIINAAKQPDVPYFAFSLPRASRSGSTAATLGEEDSITDRESTSPQQRTGRAVSTSYVLDSEYLGKGPLSDVQSARLTVITAPQAHVHPLFRWM